MTEPTNPFPEGSELWVERQRWILAQNLIDAQRALIEHYEAQACS